MSLRPLAKALPQKPSLPPGASSWTALVASTTLGLDALGRLKVTVRCNGRLKAGENYRLVVHLYDADLNEDSSYVRPCASAQRAVSAEELGAGVHITLVDPAMVVNSTDTTVVAWVEPGEPDLDYDGAQARPRQSAYLGRAELGRERMNAVVVLGEQAA